jgi:hypothetical protein
MSLVFFSISAATPELAQSELNAFCASNPLVSRCGEPQDTRCASSKGLDELTANAHRAVDILLTGGHFWGYAR